MKYIDLDNKKDLRKNIGFHFTSNDKKSLKRILKEGLVPKIGDNSSNSQAKEAIDKVFFSYGMQGTIRLFNTFINLYRTANIGFFEAESHKRCMPKSAMNKSKDETLSTLEAFEATRQYMEDKVYLVFDAEPTIYEREITDEQLKEINSAVNSMEESKRIADIDSEISSIKENNDIDEEEKERRISQLSYERRTLTLQIRNESKKDIDNVRGKLIGNKDGIFDEVDYNEVKLRWENNIDRASNVHTKVIEKDGEITAEKIMPEGIVSDGNKKPTKAIDVIEKLYSKAEPGDKLVAGKERFLVDKFLVYNRMVERYKDNGLLVQRSKDDKTLVMDLENMSKYPGLEEFSKEIHSNEKESFSQELKSQVMSVDEMEESKIQEIAEDKNKEKQINEQDLVK